MQTTIPRPLTCAAALVLALLSGCATNPYLSPGSASEPQLSRDTLLRHASSSAMRANRAALLTDNDAAFRAKLEAINRAERTIEAMYYIYGDDYTSSAFSEALLRAADRGVKVRLLVDYFTNYKGLDRFSAMERFGKAGGNGGSIEVRFYNRPTREIVKDAVFLTLGCQKGVGPNCSAEKLAAINARFAAEMVDGKSAADQNISNLSMANSGMFLSGLYGKSLDVSAAAVTSGQSIDLDALRSSGASASPSDAANLKSLGTVYYRSRTAAPFQQVLALLQLRVAFALYGEQINPVADQLMSYLPVDRHDRTTAQDWEYFSDFLHHKLLLVDDRFVVLGGRNVEDSYHMRPNPLVKKYVFMDTDLQADLAGGGESIRAAFDRLWNFRVMVARIDEIRKHAPNDFVANGPARTQAGAECAKRPGPGCLEATFLKHAESVTQREDKHYIQLRKTAAEYRLRYKAPNPTEQVPEFEVDSNALLAYVENLPFHGGPFSTPPTARSYGAKNGEEAMFGKRINALWQLRIEQLCRADKPTRVVLHNAYFFPGSNLLALLGKMIDGRIECRNVRLTILTNSVHTTDLNVVNLLARQSAKAFVEYAAQKRDPMRAAHIEYYEYAKQPNVDNVSLHTKVSVFDNDVLVGSANADVRSYIRDSNNGMYIQNAPKFASDYVGHIDQLLNNRTRTTNMEPYFVSISREEMRREDRVFYRHMIDKYRAEKLLSPQQIGAGEEALLKMLDNVYALSARIVRGDPEAEAEFNRLLKVI